MPLKEEWLKTDQGNGMIVICAGVKRGPDGKPVSAGGRVLNVIATGKTYEEARARVYLWLDQNIPASSGLAYREDIGAPPRK